MKQYVGRLDGKLNENRDIMDERRSDRNGKKDGNAIAMDPNHYKRISTMQSFMRLVREIYVANNKSLCLLHFDTADNGYKFAH